AKLPVQARAVLVRGAEDLELAAREGQPRPAASGSGRASRGQLLLERREAAESLLDRVGQRAAGLAAPGYAGRRHDRPEQRVVVVATAVVAHGGADVVWDAVDPAEQLFEGLLVQLVMLVQRRAQIGDAGL